MVERAIIRIIHLACYSSYRVHSVCLPAGFGWSRIDWRVGRAAGRAWTAGWGAGRPWRTAAADTVSARPPPSSSEERRRGVSAPPSYPPPERYHAWVFTHQCCGSDSLGSICFWASWIRIRILLSSSKNSKKNIDSYCFVTSFWLFIIFIIYPTVLRIHDILVRIRRSMPLTNGSWPCYFRQQKTNLKKKFFCLLLFEGTFTSFFFKDKKSKRSHETVRIKVFLTFHVVSDPDPDS